MTKKILSIILLCCIVLLAISAKIYVPGAKDNNLTDNTVTNITVWYTDEAMEAYLNEAAIAYQEQTGIAVSLKQVSGLEYLEGIQESSVHTGDGPDAYIVNSDSLEKARLAGLAAPMEDKDGVLNTSNYPQVALNAVTYNDKILGYPFTYETAAFFYNDTYLNAMTQAESGEKAVLPTSMVGLLEFANTYDPVEGMETYLLWDVADVMYNYGFAGAYMNTGGVHGDDRNEIDIYNTDAMYCLSVYQDFNQFFSIDAEEVDYEVVLENFVSGKVMFTIGGTNMMNTLEKAKAAGTFTGEYGVTSIEMLNDTLQFKPLSVTTVVAVNEYSDKQEAAEDFAHFIAMEYVDNLYARSGKLCAHYLEEYPVPAMADMMTCYENSVALPKIVENSNYWILAELCYTNIWNGGDVNQELMDLSSQVKKEISGEEVTELKLDTPVVTESYITEE